MPNPRNVFLNSVDPVDNNTQEITFNVITNGAAPTAAISYTDGSGWATVGTPILSNTDNDGNSIYAVNVALDVNDFSVSGDNPRRATLTMTHSDTVATDTNFIDQYGYNPATDTLTVSPTSALVANTGGSGVIQITSSLATGDLPGVSIESITGADNITIGDVQEVSGESYTHTVSYSFQAANDSNAGGNSVFLNFFHQYNNQPGAIANQLIPIQQSPIPYFEFQPDGSNNLEVEVNNNQHQNYQIPLTDNSGTPSSTAYKVKVPGGSGTLGDWDENFLNSPTGDDSTWFSSVSVIDGSNSDKVLQFTVAANTTGSDREIDLGAQFTFIGPETLFNNTFSTTTPTLSKTSNELGVRIYSGNTPNASTLTSNALSVVGPYGVEFTDGINPDLNSNNNSDYRLTYTITANNTAGDQLLFWTGIGNSYQYIPDSVGTHNVYFNNLADGYRLLFRNQDEVNSIVFSSVSLKQTPMDSIKIRQKA
jgi:hypothetical protein